MLSNEKWFGASAGFYNDVITSSLRLDRASTTRLIRTPSSAGNRRTYTISMWVKRSGISEASIMLNCFSSGSESNFTYFSLHNDDQVGFDAYGKDYVHTNRVLRDTTNWYNIVWAVDTTQATDSNRYKLYINGVQDSSFASGTYPTQNLDTAVNDAVQHTLFSNFYSGSYDSHFSGYVADVNLIDGTQYDASSFGEFKNNVWIPIDTSSLTFGTNGFRLQFKQTGTSANSSGIGADTSGNDNHFTPVNLSAHDSNLPDSPENNFCTLNSLSGALHNATLSEGNLKASGNDQARIGTFGMTSGKWYWEGRCGAIGGSNFIGIVRMDYTLKNQGSSHTYGRVYSNNGYLYIHDSSSSVNTSTTYTTGDKIGVAVDLDAGTIKWYKNGSEVSGSTISDLNTHADGDQGWLPWTNFGNATGDFVLNFGQDSSFAGLETAQGNSDGSGQGDFYYTPPSGYLALCSANLPELSISPAQSEQADDHFDTILYDGSASNQTITLNFQADWLWFKERTTTGIQPQIFDSSRGHATNGTKLQSRLEPHQTLSETDSVAIQSQSGNDLVLLGGVSTTNDASSRKYTLWHWKAGGSTPTKTYKVKVVADSTDYGHGTGSNKYQFFKSDGTTAFGTNGVDLDLQEGGTYIFDWSDTTAQGHPLRFSLTNDGTHSNGTSAGSEYTTGVVKDDSAYKTTITVASGVASLYYYCANHSGMGAEVRTNDTHGSTNFDGEVLSITQNNSDAGFSIATFTGSSASNSTFSVGHGLGSTPKMIIAKQRNLASSWSVYHHKIDSSSPEGYYILLNSGDARVSSSTAWGNTAPTSTAFSTYTTGFWGTSAEIVAYCFDEVEGYSKFGRYESNNQSDGTHVFLGFRPAFLITKDVDRNSMSWIMYDNKRDTFNEMNNNFSIGTSSEPYASSGSSIDFLSNGFKFRDGSSSWNNYSTESYIYMAFAEMPFKFSNAR
jgi:hypothetical protein